METDLKEIEDMKIEKKIYRLRHRHGFEWGDIVNKIKDEFNQTFTITEIEDICNKHIARPKVISNIHREKNREAAKVNGVWLKDIEQIIKLIKKTGLQHYKIASKKLLEHAEDGDDKKYFSYLPTMMTVQKALLDQVTFLSRDLAKIKITQNKLVLNETQILQIVNDAYAQKAKDLGYFIHPGHGRLVPIKKEDR